MTGEYRGADGWIYDESGFPQRYPNTENVQGPPPPRKGKPKPTIPPIEMPAKCPNCALHFTWRRMEGYCTSCGWGREEAEATGKKSNDGAGCCIAAGVCTVFPLVGMGMGYGAGGLGGLLAGLGIGIAVPVIIILAAITGEKRKK